MSETSLPLQGVRVLERSGTLAGRLAGLLLADQGAAVFALDRDNAAEENIDHYLNRGKNLVPAHVLAADENADIHIGDIRRGRYRSGSPLSSWATRIVTFLLTPAMICSTAWWVFTPICA